MLKGISFFLAGSLLIAIVWEIFLPEWRFASRDLRIIATAITPFVFVALIGCLIAVKFKSWQAVIPTCLFLTVIGGCISWTFLHPLDSHSEPIDIATVRELGNNRKEITRIAYNNKHNAWETNTAIVEQWLFFRRIVSETSWQLLSYIPDAISNKKAHKNVVIFE